MIVHVVVDVASGRPLGVYVNRVDAVDDYPDNLDIEEPDDLEPAAYDIVALELRAAREYKDCVSCREPSLPSGVPDEHCLACRIAMGRQPGDGP